MDFRNCRTNLPVLLLYDLNPAWLPEEIADRRAAIRCLQEAIAAVGHPVRVVCLQSAELKTALKAIHPDEYLILNWCEEFPGIPHSEYQVARVLEKLGFAFTGSDSRTLALGQDKRQVKRRLQQRQIPIPAWQVYTASDKIEWSRFPAIVKPALEHCSYGITRESVVESKPELAGRIQYILDEFHQPAVVEEFIDSREFHVGVIGNGTLRMLPPAEIDYSHFPDIHDRLCTYESNVDKTSLAYQLTLPKLPVVLTTGQLHRLEEIVIAAYRATGCRDYARMDVRLRDDTFYVLDVNPNPDISADTSFALGAELAGISYGRLGSMLVNLAAQRHPKFGLFDDLSQKLSHTARYTFTKAK